MILYLCKYAPIELLAAMGAKTEYLEPNESELTSAESYMHSTVCSFIKAAFEAIQSKNPEGVLFTSCCDSTRRLYDVIKRLYPNKFIYMVELPVNSDTQAESMYEKSLIKLIDEYESFSGKSFSIESFQKALKNAKAKNSIEENSESNSCGPSIGLTGAKFSPSVLDAIEKAGGNIKFDVSCSAHSRDFNVDFSTTKEEVIKAYASSVRSQHPCMRMVKTDPITRKSERRIRLENKAKNVEGIIYHTIKFCDNYAYEYASLKDMDIPILKIETDYSTQSSGQLSTRLEAFVEQLTSKGESKEMNAMENRDNANYIMGIDSGSTSTNAVILDKEKNIVAIKVIATGPKATESAEQIRKSILEEAHLTEDDIYETVATGYGRINIPFADNVITEITCHGKGAHFLNPYVQTIIDIGGQDSKVIRIDETGNVVDFAMNDKCAAGTGRFLEMTARNLDVPLNEMGERAIKSTELLTISSMCTVFAESEVISLVAQNKSSEDILWALCRAIAARNEGLIKRASGRPEYMMTGGVAYNIGVVKALEKIVNSPIVVSENPEIAGALGAALLSKYFEA